MVEQLDLDPNFLHGLTTHAKCAVKELIEVCISITFKALQYLFGDRSKAVLLFWIILVFCALCVYLRLSCLFLASFWSPAGLACSLWFLLFLSLSHMVSWVRCPGSGVVFDCVDS